MLNSIQSVLYHVVERVDLPLEDVQCTEPEQSEEGQEHEKGSERPAVGFVVIFALKSETDSFSKQV
jgi:hypothetical protein